MPNRESEAGKKPKGVAARIFGTLFGLFFLFGDRALREFWHFSFFGSLMIWAGLMGSVLIGWLIYMHLRNE